MKFAFFIFLVPWLSLSQGVAPAFIFSGANISTTVVSTPFTPTNPASMTTPAIVWLVPADYCTNCGYANKYTMPDRSVDTNHCDSFTTDSNNKPPTSLAFDNGRILSNGIAEGLYSITKPAFTTEAHEYAFSFKINQGWPPGANKFLFTMDSGNQNPDCYFSSDNNIHIRGDSGAIAGNWGGTSNVWYVMNVVVNGASSVLYTNGVQCLTGTITQSLNSSGWVFPGRFGGAEFSCYTGEQCIFTNVLSTTDRANLYNFWKTNYPTMALP